MIFVFSTRFKKRRAKLSGSLQAKLKERLRIFAVNPSDPILNNHRVDRAFPGCRSINITGDYRAIFQEEGDAVMFLMVGTHSELYGS